MSTEKRFDRRRFFREGLREMLKPLSRAVEPMQRAIEQFDSAAKPPAPEGANAAGASSRAGSCDTLPAVWIRPPGAIHPDKSFRDTCSKCRKCIEVCPAECIQIDPTGRRGNGAPFIHPEEMPCVLCDGLQCMHNCPTGALSPIPIGDIDMGTALWNESICVRSKGENCTRCIDTCPVGSVAIELEDNKIRVIPDGCVGCGVCQHQCPTEPKAIIVLSREMWEQKIESSQM